MNDKNVRICLETRVMIPARQNEPSWRHAVAFPRPFGRVVVMNPKKGKLATVSVGQQLG